MIPCRKASDTVGGMRLLCVLSETFLWLRVQHQASVCWLQIGHGSKQACGAALALKADSMKAASISAGGE